ncbi:putative glycoside hydrolase [Pontiellaceae bacterium B12227]|nr:putative glycoside hydrolase [Pontiellaceae bacterium B12227]
MDFLYKGKVIKNSWSIGVIGLFLVGIVQANTVTTLSFTDLNPAFTSNTLSINGSTDNLLVTGGATNNDALYSVIYTGADFDGDSARDTLTFDVLVEGLSDSVVSNGGLGASSAAIGATDSDVVVSAGKWFVGDTRMNLGETFRFTIVNAGSSVGTVSSEGFESATANENASHSHEAVIGEGVSLDGFTFNDNLTMAVRPASNPLYISSATENSIRAQWGVGDVDFRLSVEVEVERTVVNWDGSVDGNWNMPGNWSSNYVPGTVPFELAVLSGSNDVAVVATVVETTNSCAIQIIDEALLEVADGKLLCDEIILDGGRIQLVGGAEVEVSGDLRVGDSSSSSMELRSGSLAVDGEVDVGNGVLEVDGNNAAIDVNDLTVSSNATLRFDFDLKPASTIQVADHFSIAEGAKLEIDLRGYNTGGNELELVTFSSVSGSFDPADVTITGLGGGVVSMDGDSLNLTVIDDVAERSCALWFVATGGNGADALDLQVNTGRRIRNISSPDMSYALTAEGNEKIYSASWAGSDFDGDGVNDTVSFDLRVEGFSGSTYSYDETAAVGSMTQLGSADVVSGDSNGWGVGVDKDLDAGQTLRFSVENLSLSTSGGVMEGFVGVQLAEGSGNNHILMIGEGDDLQTQKSNFPVKMGFSAEHPLLVTSAANSGVKANQVAFKLMVSDLPDFLDTETGDYSHYPMGPQHRSDYPAVTNVNYPAWSWDTLPMSAGVHRNDTIPDAVAQLMATTYPVISLGGRNFYGEADVEAGMSAVAAALKQYNPDVFTTTYKNAGLHHNRTAANAYFDEEEWTLYDLDEDGNRVYDTIRGWYRYNHDHPQCREWWSDWCVARLDDPNIDGIFIDKATGGEQALLNDAGEIEAGSNRVKSYVSIRERMPEGDMLTGNILRTSRHGGSRELLHLFNGAYSEGWEGGNSDSLIAMSRADAICHSLQMFREARMKGLMVNPNYASLNHFVLSGDDAKAMIAEGRADEVVDIIREGIQLPLAYHLITLAPHNYFSFQVVSSGEFGDEEFLWNTKPYIEEFRHPLGEPLGPPVRNGYIFTRSYEHLDVWLNVEADPAECKLTWDWMPVADAQTLSIIGDQSVAITLSGSEPRGSNFTYEVFSNPTNGSLTGTAPNLVYTPNPGFSGEDSFTFKTVNELAKSLKATVTISANTDYSIWAASYGLAGSNALASADIENQGVGDGYNNLAEYALGMNPTNSDAGSGESVGTSAESGTNWFEYVHNRRADYVELGLSYLLIDSTDLVGSVSNTNAPSQLFVGPAADGFAPVTNRYRIDASSKFIQLLIQQD